MSPPITRSWWHRIVPLDAKWSSRLATGFILIVGIACFSAPPVRSDDGEKKPKDGATKSAAPPRTIAPIKRLHHLEAEELRKELTRVPEVGLDAVPGTSANLVALAARCRMEGEPYLGPAVLTRHRLDLACLPLVAGAESVLGKEPAEDLQAMSRKLRRAIEACIRKGCGDPRPDADELCKNLLDKESGWLKPEAVRCMRQMLVAENRPVRQVMVEVMARIPDRIATETLAMTAMTDLAPEVREAAVKALAERPAEDYRPLLLAGLRYPWNGVVAHAAEALVALEGKQATAAFAAAILEPDPNVPVTFEQGKQKLHVVRELVRVNHLANCVLCHAPSLDSNDLVRGAVPIPGQPLPGPATTPQYYESGESFVRADITYLRQHFSVLQPVLRSGQWPNNQRFDYLVRLRPITSKKELEQAEALKLKPVTPQKEILMRVVKELTGRDPGETPEEWRKLESARPERADQRRLSAIEKEWGRFLPIRSPEK